MGSAGEGEVLGGGVTRASPYRSERGPIALAEKVLALLDEGRFTATYKYAVLLALIDLCLEKTSRSGEAPDTVVTRELAEKVLEIYWPHCVPYAAGSMATVLIQNAGRPGARARIVREIKEFRERVAPTPSSQLARARAAAPEAFERLVREVEWTLIEMPLPRLQQFAHGYDPFLYSIAWDRGVRKTPVSAYQRGERSEFDNRIQLMSGVGEHLVMLNGLLRPFIHREWARQVAQINGLEEARLEEFLFGAERIPLDAVRPGLREVQDDRCFYCDDRLGSGPRRGPEVDHFIPWARYPNNAVENLVVAHERCNGNKRDFLAAAAHVERWRDRLEPGSGMSGDLQALARSVDWESDRQRSVGVARGIYLHLPADVPLWLRGQEFVELHPEEMATILA